MSGTNPLPTICVFHGMKLVGLFALCPPSARKASTHGLCFHSDSVGDACGFNVYI